MRTVELKVQKKKRQKQVAFVVFTFLYKILHYDIIEEITKPILS